MTATVGDEFPAGASARVGTVLCNKYRLDRVLGVGGMATVYAAVHLRNANRVAVKVLHRELAVDGDLRARFLREGYAANSVEHAGTVRILDDDTTEDGALLLVMELLEGETLDARWARAGRKLAVEEVASLIGKVLGVLVAAHGKGIVHRDIKPENLFLTESGDIKVLDFGVARLREASPTRTRTGAVYGTPAFMPPEQALGRSKEVDALSDLWAVGATAFTLLSGRFVHTGETAEEMLIQSATRPAPPLASVAPEVPHSVADVIDRALAFDKADRWPSARAMRDALTKAVQKGTAKGGGDWADDERTQLAPPPTMTLRGTGASAIEEPPEQTTVALPALSTVAGVTSSGAAWRVRHWRRLLGAGAGGALLLVVGIVIALATSAKRSKSETAPTPAFARTEVRADLPAPTAPSAATSVADEPPVVAVEALPTVAPAPQATAAAIAPWTSPSPRPAGAPAPRPAELAPQTSARAPPPAAAAPPMRKRDPLAP